MDLWISKSNPDKQAMLSAVCTVVGLAIMIGFRDFRTSGDDAMAGFLLGTLLSIAGVVGFLASGKQTVIVDPNTRCITVKDSRLIRAKKRSIPFRDIVEVSIGCLGKKSNCTIWYHLVLKLRSGEEYPLFSPNHFFEGRSDRAAVISWKRRLEEYLGQ